MLSREQIAGVKRVAWDVSESAESVIGAEPVLPDGWTVDVGPEECLQVVLIEIGGALDFWRDEPDLYGEAEGTE